MATSNKKHNNELLQKIANHLIINSSFLENLELFHGNMRILILKERLNLEHSLYNLL